MPVQRGRPPTFRPVLETLEDRRVPAITVTQAGNVIFVIGSNAAEFAQVTDNGSNAAGSISISGTGLAVPFLSLAVPAGQVIQLQIFTAGGNDLVLYNLTGNLGAATGGRDVLASLGQGNDTLRFHATEDVDIASGKILKLNANGGTGEDRISALYHGRLQGTLSVLINGGLGVARDRVFIDQTFDGGSNGASSAQALGGAGGDLLGGVIKRLTPDIALSATGLLFGGGGFDTGIHSSDVMAFSTEEDVTV
jgi:hypothetical protein